MMNREGNAHMKKIEDVAKRIDERWGEGTSNKVLKIAAEILEKLAVKWYAVETH